MFLWRGCDVSEACWLLKNNYFQKEICKYKGSCAFVKGFHRLFIMSNQSPEMKMEPLDYCTHSASSRHRFLTQQCKILYQCISKSLMHICQMHFHKCGRRKSSRDFRAAEKHVSDKSRTILQSWLTVLSCVFCFWACVISVPYESQDSGYAWEHLFQFGQQRTLSPSDENTIVLLHNKEKNKNGFIFLEL